jgi:hypothetical protein
VRNFPEPKRAWIHFPDGCAELADKIKRTHPKNALNYSCLRNGYWRQIKRDPDGELYILFYDQRLMVTFDY